MLNKYQRQQLESIGFYTLTDSRAQSCSVDSPLWRCELLVTSRCNFNCPYCRKRSEPDIDSALAYKTISGWICEGLRNIRFSGGEPTLYDSLFDLVYMARRAHVEHVAVSTNGSAEQGLYEKLLIAGVNDFSVSLDACCAATADKMSGTQGQWVRVVQNIQFLAARTYATVGIVLSENNVSEAEQTILLADSCGVADIRIIPAAQVASALPALNLPDAVLARHPILKYRATNITAGRSVRGLSATDNPRCPLVLDDMAVDERGYHYPCIIYLRECGEPIGLFRGDMRQARRERQFWAEQHDCFNDPICRTNCLDVCVDYNNRCKDLKC